MKYENNATSSAPLQVIPLGGVETIGMNCTLIRYGNDYIVIDAGVGFPMGDQHGVDVIIPNPQVLRQLAPKIKGLVITHGHMDHIGSIPYLIKDMGFPTIYASRFARELIEGNLKRYYPDIHTNAKFFNVHKESELTFGQIKVSFFGVNHSIPESMGIIVRTPKGNLVLTGDFKFDNSPVNEPPAEFNKIAKIGAEGVLCLLSDSTNSFKKGHSLSETQVINILEDVIADVKGRVVIATFSSMVNRLIELLRIAQKYNKKVFISGRSMENAISIARKTGYAKLPENLFITADQLKNYKDKQIMILSTGAQGEAMAALKRMATNKHKDIKIKKGDTVLLSASIIPGNGAVVQMMIDELSKLGANVYHNEIMDLHTSGHGFQEDQKLMINLVRPKYFIPVHGYQSFLREHAKTAQIVGVQEKNIIIPTDGAVIQLERNGWKIMGQVEAKPIMVSGSIVGDVGDQMLEMRQQLASYGVFAFSLVIDSKTHSLLSKPFIDTRGFIFVKHSQQLLEEAEKLIVEIYEKNLKTKTPGDIKFELIKSLSKLFYQKTEREPVILPLISYL